MRIITTLFFVLSFMSVTFAQTYKTTKTAKKKAVKQYQKGSALSRANDNKKALKCFEKALKIEPTFINAKIKWAAIQYDMGNNTATEKALEEVIALDAYYNTKLLYTLGVIKKKRNKCSEAKKYFQKYINAPKARESLVTKAKKGIEDCNFMATIATSQKSTTTSKPIPMPPIINTRYSEYFPALSADGEVFFFTRVTRNQEDILLSVKKDGKWTSPQLVPEINTDDNEGNQSISADGRIIVFTACNRRNTGYGSCDIYYSEYKNGHWIPAQNIGNAINSSAWESQPSISADGNTLYFTSKRAGNKGGSDIYVSTRNANGKWSKAQPVKGEINTSGNEQTPFIHQDGQTMYFKSNGHPGLGGFDIFVSRKKANGTWGKPTNLGRPINSSADDGSFTVNLDGTIAYFDSDKNISETGERKGLNPNRHDIYSIELPKDLRPLPVTYVKAKVIDATTKRPLVAQVEFMDVKQQGIHASNTTDKTGTFLVTLPYGKNYGLNVSKKGYLFHSENFALDTKDAENQTYELLIELHEIPPVVAAVPTQPKPTTTPANKPKTTPKPQAKPTPIVLKNIFFASGSAVLEPSSNGELNRLYTMLTSNPTMRIQINGHTDNVGSDDSNLRLSDDRAKAVYTFLMNKGIASHRLRYKGYGETQPIDTNDTPLGRQNNRRTEFVVW